MSIINLFLDAKKSLKIKENEVFEVLRSLNSFEWLPIYYNGRTSNEIIRLYDR